MAQKCSHQRKYYVNARVGPFLQSCYFALQDIHRNLWNAKFNCHIYKINPAQILPPYCFKVFLLVSILQVFLSKICVPFFSFIYTCYTDHLIFLDLIVVIISGKNNRLWSSELLQFSPLLLRHISKIQTILLNGLSSLNKLIFKSELKSSSKRDNSFLTYDSLIPPFTTLQPYCGEGLMSIVTGSPLAGQARRLCARRRGIP
jgi:hypothetical protein